MADHGDIGSSVVQQQQKQPKQPQDNIIIISNRHHHRRSRKLYRGKGKGYGYTHPFHPPEADDEGPNNDGPGESSSSGSSSSNGWESDHDEDESWSDDWSDDWNDDWNDDEQAEDDDDNDNDNTNGKKKKPESESSSSSSSTPKNNNNDDDKKDSFAGDNEEDNNKDESSESPSTASPSASNNDKKDDENEESSSTTTTTTTTTSGNQVVNQEGEESTTTTTTTSGSNNNDAQEEEKEAPHENQDVVIVIPSNKDEDDNDAVDEENAQESDFNPQPVNEDSPGDGNDENEDDDDDDDNHDNDDDDNNDDDDGTVDDDDGDWPTAANDFAEVSGDSMLDACVNACAGRVYETDESVFVPFEYQLIIPADHDQEESIDLVDAAVQEYLTRELIFSRCHEYIDPLILQQCPMDDLIGARRWLLLQQQQRRRIDEWDLQAVRGVGIGFTNELLEGCSTLGDRNKVCSVMEGTSVIYLDEELAADVDHAAIIEDIALMIYKSGIVVGPFSEIQVNFKPPPGIAPDKVEDGDGDRDPGTVEKKESLPISVSGIVILIVGIIGVSVGSGYYMVKRNKRKGTRGIQLDESFDETGAPTRSSVTKLSTPPALTMGSTEDRDVEREQEPVFDTDDSSNCDIGSPAQILADLQRQEHEEAFKEMSYEVEFPSHVQPSIPDLRPFSPKVSEELDSQHEGSSVYMSPRSYNVGNTVQL